MSQKLLVIAAVSSVLLLSACGPLTLPTDPEPSAPTTTAEPTATPTSAEPAPAGELEPTVVGTCTDTVPNRGIPTIYAAFSADDVTPFTMSYMVFNADGTTPVVTETATGPVVIRMTYACTDAGESKLWTFTVDTDGALVGCTQTFGGLIVDSDHAGENTPATADCTGNPGM